MGYKVHWLKLVSGEEIMGHILRVNYEDNVLVMENPIKLEVHVGLDDQARLGYMPYCIVSKAGTYEFSLHSIIANTEVSDEFVSDYIEYLMSAKQSSERSEEDLTSDSEAINNVEDLILH